MIGNKERGSEMGILQSKPPLRKELARLKKQEERYLAQRTEEREPIWNRLLAEKVPEKLQETLHTAFAKAFRLVFEKGTGLIEKTYAKERLERESQVDAAAVQILQDKKSLRTVPKKAAGAGRRNALLSGTTGIGLGALGVGIPDIPLFAALLLKTVYETALRYGFSYDTPEEKILVLLLIRGGIVTGPELTALDRTVNRFLATGNWPEGTEPDGVLEETARALAEELLYLKFLQGVPLVGVVGGAYDGICLNHVARYAELKYRRRFYLGQVRNMAGKSAGM